MKLTLMVMFAFLSLPAVGNAQTCKPESIPATSPTRQFTDNHDGTVTDIETGLMWKRCSEGQVWDGSSNSCNGDAARYTWKAALDQAQTINKSGGFAAQVDWRMPNIKELRSIVERQCNVPSINLVVFPSSPPSSFWSSSEYPYSLNYYDSNSQLVRSVIFDGGYDFWFGKDEQCLVRLVRNSQ